MGRCACVLNHMQGVWLGLCASGSWSLKGWTMQQPHGPQGWIEGHARCPARAWQLTGKQVLHTIV